MKKISINILVECLSLISFSLMVSTGLILEFILPPGSGRIEMLGHGRRHQSIAVLFGLTRHEWGDIHLWCGIVFLALLTFHILLHWNWIKGALWAKSALRRAVLISVIVVTLSLLLFPFVGTKEELTKEEFQQQREIHNPNFGGSD